MAKKTSGQQPAFSPVEYIRTKARTLPIVKCYINESWQEDGLAYIMVVRQHKAGTYTVGKYLVDTFCLGVKDTGYYFSMLPFEFEDIMESMPVEFMEISYNEAHNIIYGAVAFAEELGIESHRDFRLTEYILEEDDEEIPLIEYDFGKDGEPFLITNTRFELNKYLAIIKKTTGGEVRFMVRDEEEEESSDEYDDYEEVDDDYDELEKAISKLSPADAENFLDVFSRLQEDIKRSQSLPSVEYNYVYPNYPSDLKLNHSELEVLYDDNYYYELPRAEVEKILQLPRATLIQDLNYIIQYELGKTYGLSNEMLNDICDDTNSLTHVLFLAGELKAEECLPAVLEIFRQRTCVFDYFFGDYVQIVFTPTLYAIAGNKLNVLLEFMKEPGFPCYPKGYLADAVVSVVVNEPNRRAEAIEWFREIFRFLKEHISDTSIYDAGLVGCLVSSAMDIQAVELLPEIKTLYSTGLVDEMCCGDYNTVEDEISFDTPDLSDYSLNSIYERYQVYKEMFDTKSD